MRRILVITSMWAAAAAALAAQAVPPAAVPPATLRLTVDEAVRMSLEHNIDLAAARLDPQIGDTRVAAATGAFKPVFGTSLQRDGQRDPPSSFLIPTVTQTDVVTSSVGLNQKLPWFGTSYNLAWSGVHTNSNSFLNSFNPILQSGLSLNVSQPLVRDLAIDNARLQLGMSRIDREVAGTRLRESLVRTVANVKRSYWNLVTAVANVEARKSALELAQELVRANKAKVDVGQSPPLDLVSARAEVAADQEQVIIAETTVKQVEDQLRMLIFDTSDRRVWNVKIEPADAPPLRPESPDLDAAVSNALRDRVDLMRARREIDSARLTLKYEGNQRLPDVRLNAGYLASGLGGTQVLRTDGFPGTVVGAGSVTNFGSVLNQVFTNRYPTWSVGVSVNYPIGESAEDANFARARLEQAQSEERLKSAEARAIQEVRDAWRKIDMNAKRIETARAARELAEQRLDAERKRFDAGMSTSFLVIQAQRDLAQARTNELGAILSYDLALVDFEAVQQAGAATTSTDAPATGASGTGGDSSPDATGTSPLAPALGSSVTTPPASTITTRPAAFNPGGPGN